MVERAPIAVAFVSNEQAAPADRPEIFRPSAIDNCHQDVMGQQRVPRPSTHAASPPEDGHAGLKLCGPLVLELDGRDQHDDLTSSAELI
jgi:hypothetical protein